MNLELSTQHKRTQGAMQYANQLWQADTMFGPHIRAGDQPAIQTKLIAFIDDASRVLCHGEFFLQENTDTMINALRSAFYKRGIPEQLYVDNGSVYTSKEITLICARVGCILRHAPVRDGAAKGKIERFFRTVRLSFLSQQLDLSSLAALNRQFADWVESEYNHKTHSSLGMKPIDRFGLDRGRIRYLPNLHASDDLFYTETERSVLATNTFSFKGKMWEAPVLLAGKKIQVRFDRHRLDTPVVVYFKNQRLGEAKLVDLIANGLLRRANNHSEVSQ